MGPKSYAVLELSGKSETKMKGFTLHHKNSANVNLSTMRRLIDNEVASVSGDHLSFTKKAGNIFTRVDEKKVVYNYTKRIVVGGYNTVPIGCRLGRSTT
jgi:hypothetical protein